jgi:hypothetical protein
VNVFFFQIEFFVLKGKERESRRRKKKRKEKKKGKYIRRRIHLKIIIIINCKVDGGNAINITKNEEKTL